MTATSAITTAPIEVLTVDQRAGFLRELAEHVESERRWAQKPFTEALPGIVPAVAAAICAEPLVAFDQLVDALTEFREFVSDERGYADRHDIPTNERAVQSLYDRLQSDVDTALQNLLGGAS